MEPGKMHCMFIDLKRSWLLSFPQTMHLVPDVKLLNGHSLRYYQQDAIPVCAADDGR